MKTRKIFPIRNFPHRFFAVVAIFTLIAFLLTLKPIAKFILEILDKLNIPVPNIDIFRNVAGNMLLVGLATMAILVAGIIAVPIVKIAVTVTAVAVVGVALYNVYKSFTNQGTQNILPEARLKNK
jgi:hypothetical protein